MGDISVYDEIVEAKGSDSMGEEVFGIGLESKGSNKCEVEKGLDKMAKGEVVFDMGFEQIEVEAKALDKMTKAWATKGNIL